MGICVPISQLKKLRPGTCQRSHSGCTAAVKPKRKQQGGGRGRQRAPRGYLVQSGCDEGEEDQPPHGAAHDERHRVVHFIWLHLGLCLGQGRGREGRTRGDRLWVSGGPPARPCTLGLMTNAPCAPNPSPHSPSSPPLSISLSVPRQPHIQPPLPFPGAPLGPDR